MSNDEATPRNEPSLYDILGVSPQATEEQLRQSYKRKALTVHPDRAGAGSTAQFQQLNHAYHVLSDPKLRRAYDRYGERGVELVNNQFSVPFAKELNMVLLRAASFAFVAFTGCFIALLANVGSKIDGVVTWSWIAVLWPVWVIDVILMGVIALLVVKSLCSTQGSIRLAAVAACLAVPYVVGSVLCAVVLHTRAFGALPALAPPIAVELVLALWMSRDALDLSVTRQYLTALTNVEPPMWCTLAVTTGRLAEAWQRLVLLLLIGLRIDGYLGSTSFVVVFIAQYIRMIAALVAEYATLNLRRRTGEIRIAQIVCSLLAEFLWWAIIVVGLVLIAEKAQSGGTTPSASMNVCLVPFYIIGSFLFVSAVFSTCIACVASGDAAEAAEVSHEPQSAAVDGNGGATITI